MQIMAILQIFKMFNLQDISVWTWIITCLCAILIGIGKTGLSGAGLIVVPLMASAFGGKPSTGIVLPMLCLADLFAVFYYHRHADWKHIYKLLPWTLAGLVSAVFMGSHISDHQFKMLIGVMVLISLAMMIWQDYFKKSTDIPSSWWFSAIFGFAAGFSTMIGNAAGPLMAIYLLSSRLEKNNYIGTGAWFFLIINFTKIPLQIFFWNNITFTTLSFDLLMLPAIALGAFLGFRLVKIIPDKAYRWFILISTAISAIFLF
jgi:uncharacterized protein